MRCRDITLLQVQQVPHHVLLVFLLHKSPLYTDATVCKVFTHIVLDLLGPDPPVPLNKNTGIMIMVMVVHEVFLQLEPPTESDHYRFSNEEYEEQNYLGEELCDTFTARFRRVHTDEAEAT